MRKSVVFNHVTLDGYFVDSNSSMAWAKANTQDPEWNAFVVQNASGEGPLLFGRITYELMSSYWPTPLALEQYRALAERMNNLPKFVFSRTLSAASWNNTKLVHGDLATEIRRMKEEPGDGMAILGSGTLVSQLAQARLIDEYQFVVNPIVLGTGGTMFDGLKDKLSLKLTKSRTFQNGNVFLSYEQAA
jgi:dihydrofolate reductase